LPLTEAQKRSRGLVPVYDPKRGGVYTPGGGPVLTTPGVSRASPAPAEEQILTGLGGALRTGMQLTALLPWVPGTAVGVVNVLTGLALQKPGPQQIAVSGTEWLARGALSIFQPIPRGEGGNGTTTKDGTQPRDVGGAVFTLNIPGLGTITLPGISITQPGGVVGGLSEWLANLLRPSTQQELSWYEQIKNLGLIAVIGGVILVILTKLPKWERKKRR